MKNKLFLPLFAAALLISTAAFAAEEVIKDPFQLPASAKARILADGANKANLNAIEPAAGE